MPKATAVYAAQIYISMRMHRIAYTANSHVHSTAKHCGIRQSPTPEFTPANSVQVMQSRNFCRSNLLKMLISVTLFWHWRQTARLCNRTLTFHWWTQANTYVTQAIARQFPDEYCRDLCLTAAFWKTTGFSWVLNCNNKL